MFSCPGNVWNGVSKRPEHIHQPSPWCRPRVVEGLDAVRALAQELLRVALPLLLVLGLPLQHVEAELRQLRDVRLGRLGVLPWCASLRLGDSRILTAAAQMYLVPLIPNLVGSS